MSKSIYLINPAPDYPCYFGADVFAAKGFGPAAMVADLAITTIAAMLPDDFNYDLCDQGISSVDYNSQADFIGLTAKVSQVVNLIALASEFRKRGKVVLIGGPMASECPDMIRPYCDILVRGEVEEIFAEICSDLRNDCWKDEYVGDKPDLALSPPPKWEKYPNDRALMGVLQTSRGCPFECEFCDVIQYLGRKQRFKPIPQVIKELDNLYQYGYYNVFLADDNFTVNRSRAKELLAAMKHWNNQQQRRKLIFTTQVSIDAAKDEELLRMCAEAGLTQVFIGIETSNIESLRETKKRQNIGIDLIEQVQRFLDQGIYVIGGMIVGFDSDSLDAFQRQYEFAMASPIPMFTVVPLVAPIVTPLFGRLQREGRVIPTSEVEIKPFNTNIIPKQMTREQLLGGVRWLANKLYAPEAFGERLSNFIDRIGDPIDPAAKAGKLADRPLRSVDIDSIEVVSKLSQLGSKEAKMVSRVVAKALRKPHVKPQVLNILYQYVQIRYMYSAVGYWDENLQKDSSPSPFQYQAIQPPSRPTLTVLR